MEEEKSARERGAAGAAAAPARVTLLHNAVIVTVDPASRVFQDGGLVVAGDTITAIGRSADVLREFSGRADEIIDLHGRFVLPGFINTHVHTSQQLARGIADDVDLMTWLHERIWPYESNMTEEDSYLSTLLCGIELIRSGVTCFAEAGGQHVSGMAKAVELLGIRACLTQSTMDSGEGLPINWKTNSTDDCIKSFICQSPLRGSLGASVNLLHCDLEVTDSKLGRVLKPKVEGRMCTIDPPCIGGSLVESGCPVVYYQDMTNANEERQS